MGVVIEIEDEEEFENFKKWLEEHNNFILENFPRYEKNEAEALDEIRQRIKDITFGKRGGLIHTKDLIDVLDLIERRFG